VPLFALGQLIYLFAITSLGIFLATLARSMPQFALLGMAVYLVLNMLSGGNTPLDSMPVPLQRAMQLSPTTHYVSFAEAILFRGAGPDVVWRDFAAVAGIGAVLFTAALVRFRRTVTETQS
jgi:ABC-2 type transport system permease protein